MKRANVVIALLASVGISISTTGIAEVPATDTQAIKNILDQACVDMVNGKIDGTTWYFQPDIIVYDLLPPLISNAATVKDGNRKWHAMIDGPFSCKYEDIQVRMLGAKHAFSGSIINIHAKLKAGGALSMRMRSTDIWEKTKDGWRAIHEHTSVPIDPATGTGLYMLPFHKN